MEGAFEKGQGLCRAVKPMMIMMMVYKLLVEDTNE
jgi:hypothetical protein